MSATISISQSDFNRMIQGLTHFAPCPYQRGAFIAFKYDKCENCGAKIYNSAEATPNLHTSRADLESHGLKFARQLPPDLVPDFHDDDPDLDEEWGCEECM